MPNIKCKQEPKRYVIERTVPSDDPPQFTKPVTITVFLCDKHYKENKDVLF
jgi:hypothetical protein